MLFSIKNKEDLQRLEELASLQNPVEETQLQVRLVKQNLHENIKKVIEPITNTTKNTSENITKMMMLTSKESNKAIGNINDKLSEIVNDRVIKAWYLLSPLSEITNPENISQFKVVKDSNSNRVNDLLTHNTVPVILFNKLLIVPDTDMKFELKGDLLKKITN